MLMPLADLRDHDRYGFVKVDDVHCVPVRACLFVFMCVLSTQCVAQAWEDGGYSDDLIVASTCSQHGLTILCPSFAVFPQRCERVSGDVDKNVP